MKQFTIPGTYPKVKGGELCYILFVQLHTELLIFGSND